MVLDNYSITSALSSIAGQYDQVSRYNSSLLQFEHFVNDATYNQFTAFEAGKGYQIYVTNPSGCTLRVTGRASSSAISVSLPSGWQMIGYPSKTRIKVSDALAGLVKGANYDRISKYNKAANTFTDLALTDYLEAGQAYFIHMLKASTWVIPASMATNVTTFTYDADGSRVKKALNGTATVYIGNLYEATGSLTTKHIYLGANRIASKTSSDTLYYHSDHLGSSNVVTNAAGAQVQLSEYKPFGELRQGLPPQGTIPINYLFTGKELDTTGLYYYGARYYDPKIGRFISADPLQLDDPNFLTLTMDTRNAFLRNPQNFNRYSYCLNNPLRYIDPIGLYSFDQFAFDTTNFIAGFGDYISFGATNYIRDIIGGNEVVNKNSGFYKTGEITGLTYGLSTLSVLSLNAGARTVVYAGGKEALVDAIAGKGSGMILGDTLGGAILNKIEGMIIAVSGGSISGLPGIVWDVASAIFAANAEGDIQVFLRDPSSSSTFLRIEEPILRIMGNVKDWIIK